MHNFNRYEIVIDPNQELSLDSLSEELPPLGPISLSPLTPQKEIPVTEVGLVGQWQLKQDFHLGLDQNMPMLDNFYEDETVRQQRRASEKAKQSKTKTKREPLFLEPKRGRMSSSESASTGSSGGSSLTADSDGSADTTETERGRSNESQSATKGSEGVREAQESGDQQDSKAEKDQQQADSDGAKRRSDEEEARKIQDKQQQAKIAEEAERKAREEEEAAARAREEEARKAKEEEARKQREAEEAARQAKEAEQAAEQAKQEEERKQREEEARKAREDEERKRKEADEAARKAQEAQAEAERQKAAAAAAQDEEIRKTKSLQNITTGCSSVILYPKHLLKAVCHTTSGRSTHDALNLNQCITFNGSSLQWGGPGGFARYARRAWGDAKAIVAECRVGRAWVDLRLEGVDEHVWNDGGKLRFSVEPLRWD